MPEPMRRTMTTTGEAARDLLLDLATEFGSRREAFARRAQAALHHGQLDDFGGAFRAGGHVLAQSRHLLGRQLVVEIGAQRRGIGVTRHC